MRVWLNRKAARFPILPLIALSLLLPICQPAYPQEVSAGLTGRVTDPSGASVPGVAVTARDVDRGTGWPTSTNEEGIYALPRIPPGRYELRLEKQGFRTAVKSEILLEVNQRGRIDVALEVGRISDSINVTGAAELLQTETTAVASVASASTIVNTPLVSRNFIELSLLAPGATVTDPSGVRNGVRTSGNGGRPYVNGNRKTANNFLLDGIDNNQASANLTAYQPNLDAIAEVKVITSNASAEFGSFQGGILNVVMKSGTNQFHGSLFEFFRNDKLNANNWARNWKNLERDSLRWNTFGGTFGGPIRRNKLFFFGNYQGIRQASPGSPNSVSVIPAEFRQGNLSRMLAEARVQLYDPGTINAQNIRQPFANNYIPSSRFSPVVQALFKRPELYPLPVNSGLRFNQYNVQGSSIKTDQGDIKVDWKLAGGDDFTFRYSNSRQDLPESNSFPLTFDPFSSDPFQAGLINWTHTFGPALVNELRLGVNRVILNEGASDKGVGNLAEQLGIQNGNARGPGLMAMALQGGYATGIGSKEFGTGRLHANTTFHYADNLTIIRGRHMMKTGGQYLRQWMNIYFDGNGGNMGTMQFNGQFTQGPNANSPTSIAFADADFLLGYPANLTLGPQNGVWGHRVHILGSYFQDDWRVTNNLTLNLGVRWEYTSPFVEVKDRQVNFGLFSGEIQFAGKDGNGRGLYNSFKKDLQPRIGFAWNPRFLGGFVVRGAYTMSSYLEGTGVNLRLTMNPPFASEYSAIYTGQPVPAITLSQGLTPLSTTLADPYRGATLRVWDPKCRPASTQQWNFFIERRVAPETVFSAGYVGQRGTHLMTATPYAQKRLASDGTVLPSPYLAGNPALRSISQIGGTASDGNLLYHALQSSLRKRMSAGLQFQTSYTFSKGMTDSQGFYSEGGQASGSGAYAQDMYNRKLEWGPTYFNAKHIFSNATVYELPFGRGRKMGKGWNRALDGVFGNWQVGGILTMRSGFAMTMSATDRSGTTSRAARPNRIADGSGARKVGPGTKWFDTAAFTQPLARTFGNSGVGVVTGPGMRSLDLSVQKQFKVRESRHLEFRTEFFNLTNSPIFAAPAANISSATFGEISGAQGPRQVQLALKFYF